MGFVVAWVTPKWWHQTVFFWTRGSRQFVVYFASEFDCWHHLGYAGGIGWRLGRMPCHLKIAPHFRVRTAQGVKGNHVIMLATVSCVLLLAIGGCCWYLVSILPFDPLDNCLSISSKNWAPHLVLTVVTTHQRWDKSIFINQPEHSFFMWMLLAALLLANIVKK